MTTETDTTQPASGSVHDTMMQLHSQFKPEQAQGMDKTFQFNVSTGAEQPESYLIRVHDEQADILDEKVQPDVSIGISSEDLTKLVSGQLNPQMAFMTGKLKVQGDLGLATKLQSLFL